MSLDLLSKSLFALLSANKLELCELVSYAPISLSLTHTHSLSLSLSLSHTHTHSLSFRHHHAHFNFLSSLLNTKTLSCSGTLANTQRNNSGQLRGNQNIMEENPLKTEKQLLSLQAMGHNLSAIPLILLCLSVYVRINYTYEILYDLPRFLYIILISFLINTFV